MCAGFLLTQSIYLLNSIVTGDAPVHTLPVAMMLPPNETHWFRDIGYQHDINTHCPPNSSETCSCEPTGIDSGFYKLVFFPIPKLKYSLVYVHAGYS